MADDSVLYLADDAGHIERIRRRGEIGGELRPLDGATSTRIRKLIRGPRDTVVAGYEDGTVAIFSTTSGAVLIERKIFGGIEQLAIGPGRLYAGSDTGFQTVIDLRPLTAEYCELMREIWAAAPIRFELGKLVPAAPAPTHACYDGSSAGLSAPVHAGGDD